jgi:hypothetical protein
MRLFKTSLITCAAIFGLLGTAPNPPTLDDIDRFPFVNMQNDMTISASFTSSGCFHYESGVMTFTPETMSYNGETKTVDFKEMAGLDLYFRDLSAKQGKWGGCTSSTSLTLTLNQDGKPVGQMNLVDDFCFREADMISPDALRYKLFEQEEDQQLTLIDD